jgi:TPR repeat protein
VARNNCTDAHEGNDGSLQAPDQAFFELGLMCSVGCSTPPDLVSAHKWFNLAAMLGNSDAIRMRVEVANEMSQSDIAEAQRAARDWLTRH